MSAGGALAVLGWLVLPFVPLAIAWLLVARLRNVGMRTPDSWFFFAHRAQWYELGGWMGWLGAIYVFGSHRLIGDLLPGAPPLAVTAISIACGLLPPAVLSLAVAALSHDVAVRVRGVEWSRREHVAQSALKLAGTLVPVAAAVLAGRALAIDVRWALGFAAFALLAFVVLQSLHRRALDFAPHALTTGPLRDRIFALAAQAKVKIGQIYVVPMAKGRIANAFAMQGETVLLTDYLLEHLSRREVDAIMAHEIAHLRHRHPRALGLVFLLGTAAATFVLLRFGSGLGAIVVAPLALALGLVVLVAASRRFERDADAGMVDLTGDPEAAITALAKITRLNHMPLEWGALSGKLMTHPSTARRVRAIGARGGLDAGRIEALLAAGDLEDATHYEPPPMAERAKIFSTHFKLAATNRISLLLVAVFLVAPLLAVSVLASLQLNFISLVGAGLAGLLFTIASSLLVIDRLAVAPYVTLRERLRERFLRGGMDPAHEGGVFVGFAPDAEPRVYENFYDWDVGYLFPREDRLVYVGEETHFALRRSELRAIARVEGAASWIRSERLRLDWCDAEGRTGSFLLRPADVPSVSGSLTATRQLMERLESWRNGEDARAATTEESRAAAVAGGLPSSPPAGPVTSQSPRAMATTPRIVGSAVFLAIASLGLCTILGMTGIMPPWVVASGLPYVFLVALSTQIFHLIPAMRWRDTRP